MQWMLYCDNPKISKEIFRVPFLVGRLGCHLNIDDATLSRMQFSIEKRDKDFYLINQSMTNPTLVNDEPLTGAIRLAPNTAYRIVAGNRVLALAPFGVDVSKYLAPIVTFTFSTNGVIYGPVTEEGLVDLYEEGKLVQESIIWRTDTPGKKYIAKDVITFYDEQPQSPLQQTPSMTTESAPMGGGQKRVVTAEEVSPILGTSFMCPYCRAVSDLENVLSVSVSPSLLGDDVLGEHEQQRFLPSRFTGNGLAIDSDGGVCTAIACPRCHMTLPAALLETPQTVISVIGAAGAGKSVFLASAVWRCRQILSRKFGVGFMDLDPVANRWINAYEEKLFFQENLDALQQIEKTELHSSDVCRSVFLNGESKLLPLPSFFNLKSQNGPSQCLVVYDSAGEHFRAGADSSMSYVTLNMLTADLLFFMFDPSADPRFTPYLDRKDGSAKNYAQRQDILLSELAARIRRYVGNKGAEKLNRPLIVGISKADMLKRYLPMNIDPYAMREDGKYALDLDKVRKISELSESFLNDVAPEIVATAKDIANEVWFIPLSALGHNPSKEGVRPKDIMPHLIEFPIVFALAMQGAISTIGSKK